MSNPTVQSFVHGLWRDLQKRGGRDDGYPPKKKARREENMRNLEDFRRQEEDDIRVVRSYNHGITHRSVYQTGTIRTRSSTNASVGPSTPLVRAFLFLMAPRDSNSVSGNGTGSTNADEMTAAEEKVARRKEFEKFAAIYPGIADDPDRNQVMDATVYDYNEVLALINSFFQSIGGRAEIAIIIFNGHGFPTGDLELKDEQEAVSSEAFLAAIDASVRDAKATNHQQGCAFFDRPLKVKVILAQCYAHLYKKPVEILEIIQIIPLSSPTAPRTGSTWKYDGCTIDQQRIIVDSNHEQLTEYASRAAKIWAANSNCTVLQLESLPAEEKCVDVHENNPDSSFYESSCSSLESPPDRFSQADEVEERRDARRMSDRDREQTEGFGADSPPVREPGSGCGTKRSGVRFSYNVEVMVNPDPAVKKCEEALPPAGCLRNHNSTFYAVT